jgi:hypothetical protein
VSRRLHQILYSKRLCTESIVTYLNRLTLIDFIGGQTRPGLNGTTSTVFSLFTILSCQGSDAAKKGVKHKIFERRLKSIPDLILRRGELPTRRLRMDTQWLAHSESP